MPVTRVLLIAAVVLGAAVVLAGCRDADAPTRPRTGGVRLFVTSEPSGARIIVDRNDTRQRTPDTVAGFMGEHIVRVVLDTAGGAYEYNVRVSVTPNDTAVYRLHGPLAMQCVFAVAQTDCYEELHTYRMGAGVRFAVNALGSVFLRAGSGGGVFWPATTSDSYVSGALPVIAAIDNGVAVSLGPYDHGYLAGRPAPTASAADGRATLRQPAWLLPPTRQHQRLFTVRGVEVREEITTVDAVDGVVLMKLTFRNISNTDDYRVLDPFVPAGGITLQDAYIGLALDPDIGVADDDWLSYDADLDIAFAYDARFAESGFTGASASAPALVGVRVLRAPAGSTVMLNGWPQQGDWLAGTAGEDLGFGMLSGRAVFEPAHEHPRIGHLPGAQGDMRVAVTAGPLTLAPDGEAEIVLAVAIAPPAAGTFESGTVVSPGDPLDANRQLYRIAAHLRERLIAAQALID